jgi:hypothetical protein
MHNGPGYEDSIAINPHLLGPHLLFTTKYSDAAVDFCGLVYLTC